MVTIPGRKVARLTGASPGILEIRVARFRVLYIHRDTSQRANLRVEILAKRPECFQRFGTGISKRIAVAHHVNGKYVDWRRTEDQEGTQIQL